MVASSDWLIPLFSRSAICEEQIAQSEVTERVNKGRGTGKDDDFILMWRITAAFLFIYLSLNAEYRHWDKFLQVKAVQDTQGCPDCLGVITESNVNTQT